jgi:hypothetical protein
MMDVGAIVGGGVGVGVPPGVVSHASPVFTPLVPFCSAD